MLQFEQMNFLTGEELSQGELLAAIKTAEQMRKNRGARAAASPLKGKTVALMFEKPSLRTRVSFAVGITELGGSVLELLNSQTKSEEPEDAIRVLQGMVHGLMLRTYDHSILERMASQATIPIINGLSDSHHPCQALADLLTIYQRFGTLKGLKLAFIGDGNNVLHSLLLLAPFLGVDVHYSCPGGYQPDSNVLERAMRRAAVGGARIRPFKRAADAVKDCHAVYTDVWASMGKESESEERILAFQDFQLNSELFAKARPDAIALHCLPMVCGQEITREIVEHERSALFQQAENRLHAQKALLVGLFMAASRAHKKGAVFSHVI